MPCLYTSPERRSTSKAPKRVLRVGAVASMAGYRKVPVVYHQLVRAEGICSEAPHNSPEVKELHDQNQNTYGPYARHCAENHFASMSANRGKFTIKETSDGEELMSRMRISRMVLLGGVQKFRKSIGSDPGFLLLRLRRVGAAT